MLTSGVHLTVQPSTDYKTIQEPKRKKSNLYIQNQENISKSKGKFIQIPIKISRKIKIREYQSISLLVLVIGETPLAGKKFKFCGYKLDMTCMLQGSETASDEDEDETK